MMQVCIFLALLSKICQVLAVSKTSGVIQESGIRTEEVGQTVTLTCSCQSDAVTFLAWYQQSLGGKPHLISSRMKHSTDVDINPAYKDRYEVFAQNEKCINDLIITDLRLSDSATYYCGVLVFNAIEFGQGVFLHVRTSPSNIQSAVHQPALQPLRLGDSVNLSCTAYPKPCAGNPSFYWFRHDESQPAIVYPGKGQCTSLSNKKPQRKSCTLNLAIKSVNISDAGTYYCALASCGEIVLGNGTRVGIVAPAKAPFLLVYCLSAALGVSIIVLLSLALIAYKMKKETCSVCKGTVPHLAASATSDIVNQDADSLHYAALSLKKKNERPHQEHDMESVCVYSRVKSRKV
uniref:Ig-like domain-containing protein n=1 Tax=Amphiprion percula TaxID=161767 RepID=A0A3P8TQK0_AMPPE